MKSVKCSFAVCKSIVMQHFSQPLGGRCSWFLGLPRRLGLTRKGRFWFRLGIRPHAAWAVRSSSAEEASAATPELSLLSQILYVQQLWHLRSFSGSSLVDLPSKPNFLSNPCLIVPKTPGGRRSLLLQSTRDASLLLLGHLSQIPKKSPKWHFVFLYLSLAPDLATWPCLFFTWAWPLLRSRVSPPFSNRSCRWQQKTFPKECSKGLMKCSVFRWVWDIPLTASPTWGYMVHVSTVKALESPIQRLLFNWDEPGFPRYPRPSTLQARCQTQLVWVLAEQVVIVHGWKPGRSCYKTAPHPLLQSSLLFCIHVVLPVCGTGLSRRWHPLLVLLFTIISPRNKQTVDFYISWVLTLSYVSAWQASDSMVEMKPRMFHFLLWF